MHGQLEFETGIVETATGTVRSLGSRFGRIDLIALDTMKNDLLALRLVEILIPEIGVKPEGENEPHRTEKVDQSSEG
jgi:hypothetical protein